MADISQLTDEQLQQALGYKGGDNIRQVSDEDLQKAIQPADVNNPEMDSAKWYSQNPIAQAAKQTGEQMFVNPIVQGVNAVTPAINGVNKFVQPQGHNLVIPQIKGPDMSNAPIAAKVEGDVAGGVAQGAAATLAGGGNPILGYGALSGVSAYGEGKPVVPAAISGAESAIPQMIAGKVGSSLASAAAKPIGGVVAKYAPNVGTALGMGGASAVQANMAGENPVVAGATGATFGLMSPMNPLGGPKLVSPEQHDAMLDKGAQIYRNVLNPGKGIINKVEVKSGGNVDDSMKLAAKENLIINSNEGKLDNRAAIDQLKTSTAPLYDQQNQILASNSDKQFNLQDLGSQVKSGLVKTTKNALDLSSAQDKVDNEINAEILRHGENVNGQTLNMIKQGMWGKSYNPLEPNANDTARAIGYAAKDAIEKAYPLDPIKESNAKIGQYLQLQKILEQTHGQVIQGGKIGKYVSGFIGGAAGLAVSSHLPVLGEALGPIVGFKAGEKINQMMNDPARITGNWAKQMSNVKINNPEPTAFKRPGVVTPEVMDTSRGSTLNQGIGYQKAMIRPDRALPSPQVAGQSSGPVIATPAPGTAEHAQMFPQSQTMPEFKNTGEAAAFGMANKNNPAIIQNLKNTYEQGLKKVADIKAQGENASDEDLGAAYLHSQKNQLYREAYEAATGTGGFQQPPPQGQGAPLSPINPLAGPAQGLSGDKGNGIKAIGAATALGVASVFNPSNSQAATVKDPDRIKLNANQYIMKNEGWEGMPYLDKGGFKHVGYGFKEGGMAWKYVPDAVKQGRRAMTKEEGMAAFNKTYPQAVSLAQRFAGDSWGNLSVNQQKSLIDMSYQMGSLHFPKLKAALQGGNYNTAAREILNSKYGKTDAPQRALQNAILMQA